MAFQQGLSGLGVASRALDVISSNVANSSTVGFKASTTVFGDTFASAMGGVSNLQVGMGGSTLAVRQSFTQGATTATNNPLDLAISGEGFFQIEQTNKAIAFSRNGQFDLDKNGYIVTSLGEKLMGYQSDLGNGQVGYLGSTTPTALQVPPIGVPATPTSGDVTFRGNLDSSSVAPTTAWAYPPTSAMYNFTTSSSIYDSLGTEHAMTLYFRKQAAPATNSWNVYSEFRPLNGTPSLVPAGPQAVTFDSSGEYATPALPTAVSLPTLSLGSGADPLDFNINLKSFTQNNAGSAVLEITQNGSRPGELTSISVSQDGLVQGRYTNGDTENLGKVILATFRNPNGLASIGDNLWVETPASGQAALAGPGDGLNGTLSSGAVEESNVDMSAELVNMIIQQRNYQANAQSIKTQDQILQTLINLR